MHLLDFFSIIHYTSRNIELGFNQQSKKIPNTFITYECIVKHHTIISHNPNTFTNKKKLKKKHHIIIWEYNTI